MNDDFCQSYLRAGLRNLQTLIDGGFQEILRMGEMFDGIIKENDNVIKENNELKERIKELEEFFKIAKERD